MLRRRLLLLVGVLVAGTGIAVGASVGADTSPPPPGRSSVGVYVDSYGDDTRGTVACTRGSLTLEHGDGTLFMENTPPGLIVCLVTIRGLVEA